MPLIAAQLAEALAAVFDGRDGYPADADAAGGALAAAYRRYAAKASAGPTSPVGAVLSIAEQKLSDAVAKAFVSAQQAGPSGATVLGPALDAAWAAFWLAPPLAFAPPAPTPPSMVGVVSVAPSGVLGSALTALFATGVTTGATAGQQALSLATVLDGWTRTVMVVNTPLTPPGPPLPPVPLV